LVLSLISLSILHITPRNLSVDLPVNPLHYVSKSLRPRTILQRQPKHRRALSTWRIAPPKVSGARDDPVFHQHTNAEPTQLAQPISVKSSKKWHLDKFSVVRRERETYDTNGGGSHRAGFHTIWLNATWFR